MKKENIKQPEFEIQKISPERSERVYKLVEGFKQKYPDQFDFKETPDEFLLIFKNKEITSHITKRDFIAVKKNEKTISQPLEEAIKEEIIYQLEI